MAAGGSKTVTVQQQLKELCQLIHQIQDERSRSEENLSNVNKTHEKMKNDNKVSSYFKNKLKGLYGTAIADTKIETDLIQQAMDKIGEIKACRNEKRAGRVGQTSKPVYKEESRKGMRRGVLMSMLQQSAVKLPVWSGGDSEGPPPLCGATPAESSYVSQSSDHVAARVKGSDGEEQWILAEVHAYNSGPSKYDVDDIDYSDDIGKPCKERHSLSKRHVIPLPLWKADPQHHNEALFQAKQLVMALYPQTTCFYPALICEPPKTVDDDYLVLFEDSSYADGYSPPLKVPQRFVVRHYKKR